KVNEVFTQKRDILSDAFGTMKFTGRFKDLEPFLKAFAEACWDHHKERRTLGSEGVIEMVDRALESLPPGSGELSVHSDTLKRKREEGPGDEPSSDANKIVDQPGDVEGSTKYRVMTTRSVNETAPLVDGQILSELHNNVVLIKSEAFVQNLMYGRTGTPIAEAPGPAASLSSFERRARDEKLAKDCLAALTHRNKSQRFKNVVQSLATDETRQIQDVVESISSYASHQFTKLVQGIEAEKDLYDPLAALFAFISHFYRCYFNKSAKAGEWSVEIDNSWPIATHSRSKRPQPQAQTLLRRGYLVSSNKRFRFSPHVEDPPNLQPDIALVLFKEAKRGKLPTSRELHWKDVKVPIEVKLRDGFDANRVCQMARYARAIKLEQFDRNFTFSLLISKTKCRVFYWDASQSYVTEIDMHKEPALFIQVIGRLASMDPQSMGYDARFSNSGRVLASESQKMATTLEVVSATPTQFHDEQPETEGSNAIVIDLFVHRPLFEARGPLFSRFTRVWEGREEVGTDSENGDLRVVKQNWADAERVSEAFLYEKGKELPNVARLVGSEAGSRTIDPRSTWDVGDILGVYRKGQETANLLPHLDLASDEEPFTLYRCDSHPCPFSRVLLRMVFKERGRSIFKVHDSRELLKATKQWVTGLWGLNDMKILHRDVSSGNLLLGHDMDSPAFIIDLGLAHWSTQREDDPPTDQYNHERAAKPHRHLTGTLPFIAQELLGAKLYDWTVEHQIYHDVESVFWVLIYVVLLEERSAYAKVTLGALLSTEVSPVHDRKYFLLNGGLDPDFDGRFKLEGRFKDLARFLSRFAAIISNRSKGKGTINLQDIVDMVDEEMSSLPEGSGKKVEPVAILAAADSGHSKRKLELAEGPERNADQSRPGQSSRVPRTIRSGSRLVRQRVEE
ncbi:hypothetical protein FRC01_006820, partial [Tulasnella sp. 417]